MVTQRTYYVFRASITCSGEFATGPCVNPTNSLRTLVSCSLLRSTAFHLLPENCTFTKFNESVSKAETVKVGNFCKLFLGLSKKVVVPREDFIGALCFPTRQVIINQDLL